MAPDPVAILDRVRDVLEPGPVLLTSMIRHSGDRRLWAEIDARFEPVDAVLIRHESNQIARRAMAHRSASPVTSGTTPGRPRAWSYTRSMTEKPKSAEMQPGPGLRIRQEHERPPSGLVAALAAFDTATISDLMNRLYTMSSSIRPVTPPGLRLAGPACTVKVFPGDNLMVHKSLDVARPGDVIVVDASSSHMTAVLGDLIATKARHRGLAGFVVDGLIRDLPGILDLGDMPVFARGITPIGPLHRGPGEIGYPVSAGGIVVQPGDIIIGDGDGVVVVPQDEAALVVGRLQEKAEAEAAYAAGVARGEFSNAWVDAALAQTGLELDRPVDE